MKYCPYCGTDLVSGSLFCHICGMEVIAYVNTNITGNNNIGIGNNNTIGDIILNPLNHSFEIEYQREQHGHPIKVKLVKKLEMIAAIVTIITACFTMYTSSLQLRMVFGGIIFNLLNIIALCLLIGGPIFLLFAFNLLGYRKMPFLSGIELERVDEENILRFIITGECPICGGIVVVQKDPEMANQSDKNRKAKQIGICQNNPEEHRFTFDHTIFKGERIKST